VLTSNEKGNIAEAAITLEAIKLGIDVLKPVADHGRYDLGLNLGGRILRVQCKWGALRGAVIRVQLGGYRLNSRGPIRSTYGADEIDALAVYCQVLESVYLLPSELVVGRQSLQLRIRQAKNRQRAAINWADRYALGAVAQLGERRHGMAEVRGSSPLSSTSGADDGSTVVGANAFRDRFGYWMERAAGGVEILITRHGRRFARLGPVDP
jgi:hypothetical protein